MDSKIVITISREYGSGGHDIGERIARELQIPFYDRDYVAENARQELVLSHWLIEQRNRLYLLRKNRKS